MARADKVEKVAELKERIAASQALLLADFRGLSVHDASALRALLQDSGSRFVVIKNTLMKRAADEAGMEALGSLLEGPTGVAFVEDDPVVAARKIVEAAKTFPALVLKGGFVEGRLLSPEEAQRLATLESRDAMLSKVAGMLKSEMSRAAYGFQALQGRFLSLLGALRDKMPQEPAGDAAVEAGGDAAVTEGGVTESEAAESEATISEVADDEPADDEPAGEEVTDSQPVGEEVTESATAEEEVETTEGSG